MEKIFIIGAGGLGREIYWLIKDINKTNNKWDIAGFIDDNTSIKKPKVIGDVEWLGKTSNEPINVVCAIGDPKAKENVINKLKSISDKVKFPNIIHPKVDLNESIKMGEGNIICQNSILTESVVIGYYNCINPKAGIGHDVVIGSYNTLLWDVNIAGNVKIGDGCLIGSGATIIQGLEIGNESIIGAGGVVIRNVDKNSTVAGNPAIKL